MKPAKVLIPAGIVLIIFGFVFHLQGHGNLGPESSFMYRSTEWFYYGLGIAAVGIIITALGVFFLKRS